MMYFSKSDIKLSTYISPDAFVSRYNGHESLYAALMWSPTNFKSMPIAKRLGAYVNVANLLASKESGANFVCSDAIMLEAGDSFQQRYAVKVYWQLKQAVLTNDYA
jgi:hypothetical protein